MMNRKDIAISYLKDRTKNIFCFFVFLFIFFLIFMIYNLPLNLFFYGFLLCFSIGLLFAGRDFYHYYSKYIQLIDLKNNITVTMENLPISNTLIEQEYQKIIQLLNQNKKELVAEVDEKHNDLIEYYTLWTHQIKTPLAAISLLLQSEKQDINQELELQLLEVEKYVDMALQYLRIDSMSSDLKLEKYSIQKIVKQAVKSYTKMFIYKDISLNLTDNDLKVITDKKWLLFVIKQILSNSLKYTEKGEISIAIEDYSLIITDTGIGIQTEDLPRLFEKGFTGYSGRIDEKSTGLGLYLTKKVLDNLEHTIEIFSDGYSGTEVQIDLARPDLQTE